MKKVFALLSILLIVSGITVSCAKKGDKKSDPGESVIEPSDIIVPTEEINLETAKSEDSLLGSYKNDTYTMSIQAGEDDMTVFTVKSGISDRVSYEWIIKGIYSAESNLVNYLGAVKTEIEYDKNGDEKSRKVVYDDGSGRMIFADGGRNIWKNSFEDIEDNEFSRIK